MDFERLHRGARLACAFAVLSLAACGGGGGGGGAASLYRMATAFSI